MLPGPGAQGVTQLTAVEYGRHQDAEIRMGEPRRQRSVEALEAASGREYRNAQSHQRGVRVQA
jgi:hypothetical protein